MTTTCTCGLCDDEHEVARKTTVGGQVVILWDNGAVTGLFSFALPNVPVVRPRTSNGVNVALRAGWLLMGEVEIYELTDVPMLYSACRWAAARSGTPGQMRRRLAKLQAEAEKVVIKPNWEVVSADRNGKPTERLWRLDRMRWPGMVVWDHCTGTSGIKNGRASGGADGCRYELVYVDQRGVATGGHGPRFRTLAEVSAFLMKESAF